MGGVRSAIDDLAGHDLALVGDGELEATLMELERASASLEAERARRVAEVARRGAFRRDGFLSTTSWLVARLRIPGGVAARYVRWSRVLGRADLTLRALTAGDLSVSAAASLVAVADEEPAAYERDEPLLLEAARSLSPHDLVRALTHWRQHADARHPELADERRYARRRLHVSATIDGMVRLDGDLDPETGRVVITALRGVVDDEARGSASGRDERTPAQRRADALGEICRRYLDAGDRPTVGGERPHLLVVADATELTTRSHDRDRHVLPIDGWRGPPSDDPVPLSRSALRQLACDASVSRVITRGGSEPLDVGRRTPVVSPAMRRALIVRDGTCRFPGCDRPHAWCDAHHVVHWADGGETAVRNLLLLCRRHHRLVHRGFTITAAGHSVVFRRPDGTVIETQAPAGRSPPGG